MDGHATAARVERELDREPWCAVRRQLRPGGAAELRASGKRRFDRDAAKGGGATVAPDRPGHGAAGEAGHFRRNPPACHGCLHLACSQSPSGLRGR